MVFFNCNGCGEAMKKNQVEKHTFRCRQCFVVSCVDCGKDFSGNDYQQHTKCMTEDEKYCGKGYVPKVNKGEAKQEQWIERVQEAIAKSTSKPNLKRLLERLQDYPNIPRKKAKFENFLKNSLRVSSPHLVSEVWEVLMAAAPVANGTQANAQNQAKVSPAPQESKEPDVTVEIQASEVSEEVKEKKLSKRERKEERQKKSKKEKKDQTEEKENSEVTSKKSKKRKHSDSEDDEKPIEKEEVSKKKKKKKQRAIQEDAVQENEHKKTSSKSQATGFDLEKTVKTIVKKKQEISLKRLRKKVLACYQESGGGSLKEEQILKKFDKKIQKMTGITILKDRVMLRKMKYTKYA